MAWSTQFIRNTQFNMMRAAVSRGISSRQLQKEMSAAGYGMRRQRLLREIASLRGAEQKVDRVKYTRKDRTPQEDLYTRTPWPQKKQYRYQVKLNIVDKQGQPGTINRYVSSDRRLTIAEIDDEMSQSISRNADNYEEIQITGWSVTHAYQKSGTQWR